MTSYAIQELVVVVVVITTLDIDGEKKRKELEKEKKLVVSRVAIDLRSNCHRSLLFTGSSTQSIGLSYGEQTTTTATTTPTTRSIV